MGVSMPLPLIGIGLQTRRQFEASFCTKLGAQQGFQGGFFSNRLRCLTHREREVGLGFGTGLVPTPVDCSKALCSI
jgi:hypothetical protein